MGMEGISAPIRAWAGRPNTGPRQMSPDRIEESNIERTALVHGEERILVRPSAFGPRADGSGRTRWPPAEFRHDAMNLFTNLRRSRFYHDVISSNGLADRRE